MKNLIKITFLTFLLSCEKLGLLIEEAIYKIDNSGKEIIELVEKVYEITKELYADKLFIAEDIKKSFIKISCKQVYISYDKETWFLVGVVIWNPQGRDEFKCTSDIVGRVKDNIKKMFKNVSIFEELYRNVKIHDSKFFLFNKEIVLKKLDK